MRYLLGILVLFGSFSYAGDRVAKIGSPACPTKEAVDEFVNIYSNSNFWTAIKSHPECKIITKGAPIHAVLDTTFTLAKVSWTDLGGHTRISWVLKEAVY